MTNLPSNVCYLATDYPAHISCGVQSVNQLMDPHIQLETYRQRARRMVGVANSAYQRALTNGMTQAQAWNVTTVDWTVAAKVKTYIHQHSYNLLLRHCYTGSLSLCCPQVIQ